MLKFFGSLYHCCSCSAHISSCILFMIQNISNEQKSTWEKWTFHLNLSWSHCICKRDYIISNILWNKIYCSWTISHSCVSSASRRELLTQQQIIERSPALVAAVGWFPTAKAKVPGSTPGKGMDVWWLFKSLRNNKNCMLT